MTDQEQLRRDADELWSAAERRLKAIPATAASLMERLMGDWEILLLVGREQKQLICQLAKLALYELLARGPKSHPEVLETVQVEMMASNLRKAAEHGGLTP